MMTMYAEAVSAPVQSVPADSRRAYEDALARLCERASVTPAERDSVIAAQAMVLGGVPLSFQHEAWSNFVKVYIEVGKPVEADALAFYRWVLTQHLVMPSPFSVVAALHPETEQVVLYGNAPMPDSPSADEGFFGFLAGCVHLCKMLRDPQGIRLEAAQAA